MRRILIDECINPRLALRLRAVLPGDTIETVRDLGWTGQQDHILVSQIQGRFDVFLTIDKGFEFEHNLEQLSFGIIVLEAANNQMPSYERLLETLVEQVRVAAPGRVARVSDPNR
jgi:predicted nuclease of predicted toxin-antitoxin system